LAVKRDAKPKGVLLLVVAISELGRISQRGIASIAFGVESQHSVNLRRGLCRQKHNQGEEQEDL